MEQEIFVVKTKMIMFLFVQSNIKGHSHIRDVRIIIVIFKNLLPDGPFSHPILNHTELLNRGLSPDFPGVGHLNSFSGTVGVDRNLLQTGGCLLLKNVKKFQIFYNYQAVSMELFNY